MLNNDNKIYTILYIYNLFSLYFCLVASCKENVTYLVKQIILNNLLKVNFPMKLNIATNFRFQFLIKKIVPPLNIK